MTTRTIFLWLSLYVLGILPFYSAQAQSTFAGRLVRQGTGESVPGARLFDGVTLLGITDEQGRFFILSLNDSQRVHIYHPGFQISTIKPFTELSPVITLFPTQAPESQYSQQGNAYIHWMADRQNSLPFQTKSAHKQPALLCEDDVLRTQLLLPGFAKGYDGQTILMSKGGSPEQNLFLIDGVPLYQPYHLFGYVSWFHPDWYSNIQVRQGMNEASTGGRASSVFHGYLKDGIQKKWTGGASINILSVSAHTEGPMGKKGSLSLFGRRSYLDLLIAPLLANQSAQETENLGLYFFDMGMKYTHQINPKNQLQMGFVRGGDVLDFSVSSIDDSTPNIRQTIQQRTSQISGMYYVGVRKEEQKGFSEWKGFYTYQQSINGYTVVRKDIRTGQDELNGTQATQRRLNTGGLQWKRVAFGNGPGTSEYGGQIFYHQIQTGLNKLHVTGTNFQNLDSTFSLYPQNPALEVSAFYGKNKVLSGGVRIYYGLRLSGLIGEDFLPGIEPRIWIYKKLNTIWDMHAGYTLNRQYLHYARQSRFPSIMDYWVLADKQLKPQTTHHAEVSVSRWLKKKYAFSATIYGRLMNLTEFQTAYFADFLYGNWKESLLPAQGRSGGIELMIRKPEGLTTGWISYSFAFNQRKVDLLNGGDWYPYIFQRLHDVTLFAQNKVGKRSWIVFTMNLASGSPYSLSNAKYILPGNPTLLNSWNAQTVVTYTSKNAFRLPYYFRIDVGYRIDSKNTGLWKEQTFNVSLYNLTSYLNPYSIYLNQNNFGRYKATQFSMFPIIPSISYLFRF